MRRVAFERFPAFHGLRSCSSSRLPITVKCSQAPQTQMGSASPQKRFFEIIQSLMLRSQSSSRASPSGGIHWMVGHHALDAVAPVHADEPFVHGTEDQLRFAAPAMRIDVRILLARHQESGGLQRRHHLVGHLAGVRPGERAEAVMEDRALIQRRDEREDRSRGRAPDPPRRIRARCGPGRCLRPR